MGTVATDRRHKVFRWIVIDGEVSYEQHDFNGGYKAVPSGMLVYSRKNTLEIVKDTHDIDRVQLPSECQVFINIRFNKFCRRALTATVLDHVEDLEFVVAVRFGGICAANLFIDSDCGADADYHTIKAMHAYGMFFKKHQMGCLIIGGPAPNNSADNDIEAAWAHPKNAISGLMVSDLAGDDMLVPEKQTGLTIEQMAVKETEILSNFGRVLHKAWSKLKFGGNPYNVRYSLPKVAFSLFC